MWGIPTDVEAGATASTLESPLISFKQAPEGDFDSQAAALSAMCAQGSCTQVEWDVPGATKIVAAAVQVSGVGSLGEIVVEAGGQTYLVEIAAIGNTDVTTQTVQAFFTGMLLTAEEAPA
jgi:hypothetical protein